MQHRVEFEGRDYEWDDPVDEKSVVYVNGHAVPFYALMTMTNGEFAEIAAMEQSP